MNCLNDTDIQIYFLYFMCSLFARATTLLSFEEAQRNRQSNFPSFMCSLFSWATTLLLPFAQRNRNSNFRSFMYSLFSMATLLSYEGSQ